AQLFGLLADMYEAWGPDTPLPQLKPMTLGYLAAEKTSGLNDSDVTALVAAGMEVMLNVTAALRQHGNGFNPQESSRDVADAFEKAGLVCESFAPETMVLMADGSSMRLDAVKVGDRVVTTDPATGRLSTEAVEAVHVDRDDDLMDLSVRSVAGVSVVHTTQHH